MIYVYSFDMDKHIQHIIQHTYRDVLKQKRKQKMLTILMPDIKEYWGNKFTKIKNYPFCGILEKTWPFTSEQRIKQSKILTVFN